MQIAKKILFLLILSILASCASHESKMRESMSQLQKGTFDQKNINSVKGKASGKDELVFLEELGRINFIIGNSQESIDYFIKVKNQYEYLYNQRINALAVSSSVLASTILDDRAMPYVGSDFEAIIVNMYQAVNYLHLGSLERAMVEVRSTNDSINRAVSLREKRINKENSQKAQYNITKMPNNNSIQATKTQAGILNAYVYYVMGNIRELYGDYNGALIDYMQAYNLNPNNSYVNADIIRLAKIYNSSVHNRLATALPKNQSIIEQSAYVNQNKLIVIYEQGFMPVKRAKGIYIGFNGTLMAISLPEFVKPRHSANNVNLIYDNKVYSMEHVVDMLDLAIYDLQEQYNGIILRQISRILVKNNLKNLSNNDTASSVLAIAGFAASAFEKADTRYFSTLPQYVQVAKITSNNSIKNVRLQINGRIIDTPINEISGNAILYVIDTGGEYYQHLISIN